MKVATQVRLHDGWDVDSELPASTEEASGDTPAFHEVKQERSVTPSAAPSLEASTPRDHCF